MKENNIFTQDIEVPDVVLGKLEDALVQIRAEGAETMTDTGRVKSATKEEASAGRMTARKAAGRERAGKRKARKRRVFQSPAVAAACVCLLAASSITAVAAVHHFWSRGMQGALLATEEQQQSLIEQGVATVIHEQEPVSLTEGQAQETLAVTDAGVTVRLEDTIVDGHFAYLAFSVEGYELEAGEEPCFEDTMVTMAGDGGEDGWLNMCATFYDGIVVSGGNGTLVYDDGTPLEYGEDGNWISRYAREDGRLEYIMTVYAPDENKSLIGETVHVGFRNLGTVYKADYTNKLNGNWEFDFTLAGESAATHYDIGKEIGDTGIILESADISPISIKLDYSVTGEVTIFEDYLGIPEFMGVVLKDGTRLPYIHGAGMTGYTDETCRHAYDLKNYTRVIDVEQVSALLLWMEDAPELYEVALP